MAQAISTAQLCGAQVSDPSPMDIDVPSTTCAAQSTARSFVKKTGRSAIPSYQPAPAQTHTGQDAPRVTCLTLNERSTRDKTRKLDSTLKILASRIENKKNGLGIFIESDGISRAFRLLKKLGYQPVHIEIDDNNQQISDNHVFYKITVEGKNLIVSEVIINKDKATTDKETNLTNHINYVKETNGSITDVITPPLGKRKREEDNEKIIDKKSNNNPNNYPNTDINKENQPSDYSKSTQNQKNANTIIIEPNQESTAIKNTPGSLRINENTDTDINFEKNTFMVSTGGASRLSNILKNNQLAIDEGATSITHLKNTKNEIIATLHSYKVRTNNKVVFLSELIFEPNKHTENPSDTLSCAYISHIKNVIDENEKTIEKNSSLRHNQTTNPTDNQLTDILGAEWVTPPPFKIAKQGNILDCAFAAIKNFFLVFNSTNFKTQTLTAKDYAKYLKKPERTLKAGIFSDAVLNAMATDKEYTLQKQEFTQSLGDDQTRGLYHANINNNINPTPSPDELWNQLAQQCHPQKQNISQISEIILTPALWHAAKGAITPQSLASLINEQSNLKIQNTHWITTTFSEQNLGNNFEENLITVFEQIKAQEKNKDINPAFIALLGNNGNGVNNHFVTLAFWKNTWYTLDSLKDKPEQFCQKGALMNTLRSNQMNNLVYLAQKPEA